MSTISKLDPTVRVRRAARRSMRIDLSKLQSINPDGAALHAQLERIARDPRVPGAWKEELFQDAITRFERNAKSRQRLV